MFIINLMINYRYIERLKEDYSQEILLISRIGDNTIKYLPIFFTTIIINVITIFLSWILNYICFSYYYVSFFNFTLLVILLIIGVSNGLLITHYLLKNSGEKTF